MAQLANCPQCDHELLIPEDIAAGREMRCPNCRTLFQFKDAKSRELTTVEFVDSTAESTDDDRHAVPTVEEFASMPTWTGDAVDEQQPRAADDLELSNLRVADELDDEQSPVDELGFSDFDELLDPDKSHDEHQSSDDQELPSTAQEPQPEKSRLHVAQVEEDDSLDSGVPPSETSEEAAQRIDAWFRSAKTLPEVPTLENDPPLEPTTIDSDSSSRSPEIESTGPTAQHATIDMGSGIEPDFSGVELHTPSEPLQDVPAWDDSHHMDQLLAEIQEQPSKDESEPVSPDDVAVSHQTAEPATDWMPDESLAINSSAHRPRRQKSRARTLVMSAVGGVVGLTLGYYALLWLRGPDIDFLQVAKYLPNAMLPSAFQSTSRLVAAAPSFQVKTESKPAEPASNESVTPPAVETAKTAAATKSADTSAEKQASFTEPDTAKKATAPEDDRYATSATPAESSSEPAAFNAPPAMPVKESKPPSQPIHITGAPSFTANDLSAAISAGKDAEAGLVKGNLTDGHDVDRTKGFNYSILADLAQKVTFVDPTTPDSVKLQQEAENIFRSTLSTPHARDEVAQIVPKWIASPNRHEGGIFFAGTIAGHEAKGSVIEVNADLATGQSLPVLLPASAAEQLKGSSGPMAVVGWIVDKPAEHITGYTGDTPQAVFASTLIPLQ